MPASPAVTRMPTVVAGQVRGSRRRRPRGPDRRGPEPRPRGPRRADARGRGGRRQARALGRAAELRHAPLRPRRCCGCTRRTRDTRIVVLANRPSAGDCDQLLSFGATACLSKDTEARDIINAIHLASRGMHVLPRSAAAGGGLGAARGAGRPSSRRARPRCSSCSRTAGPTPRSRTSSRSASRRCARTRATSTASSASRRVASSRGWRARSRWSWTTSAARCEPALRARQAARDAAEARAR